MIVCIFVLLGGDALFANPHQAFIDPKVLEDTQNGKSASFLVVLEKQANLEGLGAGLSSDQRVSQTVSRLQWTADQAQSAITARLDQLGARYQSYWIANTIAVWGTRRVVDELSAQEGVLAIEPNREFTLPNGQVESVSPSTAAVQWNITQVNVPQVWGLGDTGQGIVYATADTGVDWTHPILKSNYRGWDAETQNTDNNYNWWDAIHTVTHGSTCPADSPAPCDDLGHGTHVTGIGVGINGYGVAPGARWIGCRNMDKGVGMPSTYIECLQFLTAPTDLTGQNPNPALHADVIGNSYSCPDYEGCTDVHALQDAVQAVRAAGIFMSVSAGNKGANGCGSIDEPPGLEQAVFTVGAVDASGAIASFSSRGPVTVDGSNRLKPNLSAPGVNITSSVPYSKNDSGYASMSGTSMAAPHVAGSVALLWSAFPQLRGQVELTEQLLEQNAIPRYPLNQTCGTDTVSSLPNNVYGYGMLDVFHAYRLQANLIYQQYLPVLAN